MTFLLFMFSLFFKKQLLFVLWIFYDCKKKKARKANSHVRWLVMVGSCWCWCSRWLALYDWWLYGITERKPFFLSFLFLCTQTRLVRLSLSLSAPWWVPTLFTRPWLWLGSFLVDHEFTTFFFSSFFLINIFSTLSFDEWIPWDIKL